MEILVRQSKSRSWPPWEIWGNFDGDRIKVDAKLGVKAKITVRKLMDNCLSDVVLYSESMAVRVRESSLIQNRDLTRKWIINLGEYCSAKSPPRLTEFEKFLKRDKKSLSDDMIRWERADQSGFYDVYGFLSGDLQGVIFVRVFDIDLGEYIDAPDYENTYEVVGGAKRRDLASYWNCSVRVLCNVGDDDKDRRNVRIELHWLPPEPGAHSRILAEVKMDDAIGWRF
ncbi:MAG: hypothetical protein H6818_21080 [Phycisphaerales bacterium]|nr:hypothetical protein [Phycisphaerales bacterium]MCB9862286.1 hypothetical protein [Phycisphaerales bacterium]